MIIALIISARGKKEAPPNNCAARRRLAGAWSDEWSLASNFHVQSHSLATELYNYNRESLISSQLSRNTEIQFPVFSISHFFVHGCVSIIHFLF